MHKGGMFFETPLPVLTQGDRGSRRWFNLLN